ncbi:MAG: flavin reductase [Clostridia bacterium]|nr:flavin reductase [Clostridia bacterium]
MNQQALFKITYGLFVLTARDGGKDYGCIINTAMQITENPNRLAIGINKNNYTHDVILKSGALNLSVLDSRTKFELIERFGFHSGRTTDKFAGFSGHAPAENGIAYITESTNAYFSAKVTETVDCGTHTLFIVDIEAMEVLSEEPALTYADYHAKVKPQPKKEAKGWVCTICGYVYEGAELPENYVCPLCKHGAQFFEPKA